MKQKLESVKKKPTRVRVFIFLKLISLFIVVYNAFSIYQNLKVALQILEENFTKILKKLSLHSQSLLIFIHKTPVVEKPSDN